MDRFHRKIVLLRQLSHRFHHSRHLDIDGAAATLANQVVMGEMVAEGVIAEMYYPGTVAEVNAKLAADPTPVQTDPHGSWMIKIKLAAGAGLDHLLSKAQYDEQLASEGH